MARPTKQDKDKLTAVLPPIRCTKSESKIIRRNAKSAGLSLSDYIRQVALQGQMDAKINARSPMANNDNDPPREASDDLFYHLHRIGNNLNQLTKLYHQTMQKPKVLQNVLVSLDKLLTHILEDKLHKH